MDRDLTFEKHLLSRCYDSNTEINEVLQTRYLQANDAIDPFIPITAIPQEEPEASAPASGLEITKNASMKPGATRKANTRKEMKRYIKVTLANQKRIVAKAKEARKNSSKLDLKSYLRRYNIPQFDVYLELNGLWRKYISDLLFGDQKNPNLNMILPKLSTADYNGCRLKVLESRDRHLVGMEGIVLYDSQHSFILVVPQLEHSEHVISPAQEVGGLRVVGKRGTLFGFTVDVSETEQVGFTILGSRFELRAVDRSSKKFKSHRVEDIY